MFKETINNYSKRGFSSPYSITIIDDDFEEEFSWNTNLSLSSNTLNSVIRSYSKRNLNVARNIFLYLLWTQNKSHWNIENQISFHLEKTPQFKEYYPEIQKYLLFI